MDPNAYFCAYFFYLLLLSIPSGQRSDHVDMPSAIQAGQLQIVSFLSPYNQYTNSYHLLFLLVSILGVFATEYYLQSCIYQAQLICALDG